MESRLYFNCGCRAAKFYSEVIVIYQCCLLRWPIGAKHNSISVLKHNNLLKNTPIFWTTQQSFREHNHLFENTTIFSRTQQSFREHNNRFGNTTIFSGTQGIFLMHNNLFQSTIKSSNTQTQTKTQQNLVKHNKISKHWELTQTLKATGTWV